MGRTNPVARVVVAGVALAWLSACAETTFLVQTAKQVGNTTEETPRGIYKIGNAYQINGSWFYPAEDYDYDETGIASWYGPNFHEKSTANGEIYDMNAMTAAHRTLPMPSFVRVTNLENGRSIVLRVNDRGPFARNRILDVSRRGAQLLGFVDKGTARVRVQILPSESRAIALRMRGQQQLVADAGMPITVGRLPKAPVSSESLPLPPGAAAAPDRVPPRDLGNVSAAVDRFDVARVEPKLGEVTQKPVSPTVLYVQAGAFSRYDNANRVRARLSPIGRVNVTTVLINGADLFRVRVGPLGSVPEADTALERVIQAGYPDSRIVVD